MSAPSETDTLQSVKIRAEQRLAISLELNSVPGRVTGYREAKGDTGPQRE